MFRLGVIAALSIMQCACTCDVTRCGAHVKLQEQWHNYAARAGAYVVKFSVPETANGGTIKPPASIDMAPRSDPAGDDPGVLVFSAHWDYWNRVNYSFPDGQRISLSMRYSEKPLTGLDALRASISGKEDRYRVRYPLPPDFPNPRLRFERSALAGREGWQVRYPLGDPAHVIVVDSHHYLELAVGPNPGWSPWREDSARMVDGVMRSIRLEPVDG